MKKNILFLCLIFFFNYSYSIDPPYITSPNSNTTLNSIDVTINWDNVSGASSYIYKLDTTQNFNSPLLISFSTSLSEITFFNLNYGESYFFRVASTNGSDTSVWITLPFNTIDFVSLLTPSYGATTPTDVLLDFSEINGSSGYIIQLDTSELFSSTILTEFSSNTSQINASNLLPDATYYWRVAASNMGYDTSSWSPVFLFNTEGLTTTLDKLNKTENNMMFYPNPSIDGFFYSKNTINKKGSIYDLNGRLIKSIFLNDNFIDLSFLSSGTYNLIISKESHILIKK